MVSAGKMPADRIIASFKKIAAICRAEIDLLEEEKREHGPLRLIEMEALRSLAEIAGDEGLAV